MNDFELLQAYAQKGEEGAFTELVNRYLNLVYSASIRLTSDPQTATEVTQSVFIILARKAGSIRSGAVLPAWLLSTTRYTAANARRREHIRKKMEQQAMQEFCHNETESVWNDTSPLLDDALAALGEQDRNLVALRYFAQKSYKDIGTEMSISEEGARKRVSRAIEKLRRILAGKGRNSPATFLGAAISVHGVEAAPVGLASAVSASALAKAAVAAGTLPLIVQGTLDTLWTIQARRFALKAGLPSLAVVAALLLVAGIIAIHPPDISPSALQNINPVAQAESIEETIPSEDRASLVADPGNQLNTDSAEYEATGQLEVTSYFAFGNSNADPPVFFHAYVRGCRWAIRLMDHRENEAAGLREIAFDGQYQYNFGFGTLSGKEEWQGAIANDKIPFSGPKGRAIPVVWLALASHCRLDKGMDKMEPPYSTDILRGELPLFAVRRATGVRLPESIVFMDDGYDRLQGVAKKRRPPYDQGFTNAIFSASTFTNVGGTELPLQFRLQVLPLPPGMLAMDYQATVNSVSVGCSLTNFTPEIAERGNGLIIDCRFDPSTTGINPFLYRTNRWITEEEAHQLPGFTNYVAGFKARTSTPPVVIIDSNGGQRSAGK